MFTICECQSAMLWIWGWNIQRNPFVYKCTALFFDKWKICIELLTIALNFKVLLQLLFNADLFWRVPSSGYLLTAMNMCRLEGWSGLYTQTVCAIYPEWYNWRVLCIPGTTGEVRDYITASIDYCSHHCPSERLGQEMHRPVSGLLRGTAPL